MVEFNSEVCDSAVRGVLSLILYVGSFDWCFVLVVGMMFIDFGS